MNNFTLKEQERLQKGLPPWESMSFACGGWLQFYMYGVAKALQVTRLDHEVTYCGCSAGALSAAGIALGGDFDAGVKYCKEACIPVAHGSLQGLLQLHVYVGGCIDGYFIPHYDETKANRLQLAMTKLPFLSAERTKSYSSPADLKSALLASCAAFPAAKMELRDGFYCLDGGLTDFQPIIDSDTITVSPFYFSDADIKPSRYVPLWWAFIPPNCNDTCDWLYALGYADGMQYIKKREILKYINRNPDVYVRQTNVEDYDTRFSTNIDSVYCVDTTSRTTSPVVDHGADLIHTDNEEEEEEEEEEVSNTELTTAVTTTSERKKTKKRTRKVQQVELTKKHLQQHDKQQQEQQSLLLAGQQQRSSPAVATIKAIIHDISQVCRPRRNTPPHPYDTPGKVSIHRFLGYDLKNMTSNYVSFILDLYLLFLLVFVWKPFALFVIYLELWWRIVYLTVLCFLSTVGIDGYVLYKLRILKPSSYSSKKSVGVKLYDCILCVMSLSLLLRFISGGPSAKELRKHDRLAKNSLLYRVFRHII